MTDRAVYHDYETWLFTNSLLSWLAFSTLAVLLQVAMIWLSPNCGDIFSATAIAALGILTAIRCYLAQFPNQSHASYLYGWAVFVCTTLSMATNAYHHKTYDLIKDTGLPVVCISTILWVLYFLFMNITGIQWMFRWATIATVTISYRAMPSSWTALGQPYETWIYTGGMVFGEIMGRLIVGNDNPKYWLINWVLSLGFEDNSTDMMATTKRFRQAYDIALIFCAVVIVLVLGMDAYFEDTQCDVGDEVMFWVISLALRVHIHRQVPEEQGATRFGRGLAVTALLANGICLGTRFAWSDSVQEIPQSRFSIIFSTLCIALSIIYGRLVAIPGHYRLMYNVLMMGRFASRFTWSTLAHATEVFLVCAVVLIAELIGYTFEHQRRMAFLSANETLRKIYTTMRGTIAFEVEDPGGRDDKIVWVAGATDHLLGYTHEQCMLLDTSFNDELKSQAQDVVDAILKGQTPPMAELELVHRSGKRVLVQTDKTSRLLPSGHALVVLHDVTAKVLLREMTQQRDIQLAIAERFRNACMFLSHEIRNQLYPQSMALQGMDTDLQSLMAAAASPSQIAEFVNESRQTINMIMSANSTVTNILTRVLDLAKWETGEFPVHLAYTPLHRFFKRIESYAKAKNATVEGLDAVEQALQVNTDEHLFHQAVTNLISNADKFRLNKDLLVTLTFEKNDTDGQGTIVVCVRDYGKGMTQEELTAAMIPFKQIRCSGDAPMTGTGLGLPLSRVIVEAGLEGTLLLASEGLGQGSTATVRVPVQWKDQVEKPKKKSDLLWWVTPHPAATVDILVVDDSKLNRMVVVHVAKLLGLSYHEAADGTEALERLRVDKYSVVFMDHQMEPMNGADATEQARREGYTLPIVMVSGNSFDDRDKELLTKRGMTAFMTKIDVPGPRQVLMRLADMKKKKSPDADNGAATNADSTATTSGGGNPAQQSRKRSQHGFPTPNKKKPARTKT